MTLPPLGDLPTHPRRPYVVSPRPRNLFGHCYIPATAKKKYIYNASPRKYSPPKEKRNNDYDKADELVPVMPISNITHTPRPLRRSPAEIRQEQYYKQLGKLDLRAIRREVRHLNEINKKVNDELHKYDENVEKSQI